MKKNYIEESILISVFTFLSFFIYKDYRLSYLINEPKYSVEMLLFPLIILISFLVILNKKHDNN